MSGPLDYTPEAEAQKRRCEMRNPCTVCHCKMTVKYRRKDTGREADGDCYHCGGDGREPVLPDNYGGSMGFCALCTVVGGGHRTACPDR